MGMNPYHRHSKAVINSRRWQRLRVEALRRDEYRCVTCDARGRLEVDHVKPVRTNPELAFALNNVQCLCKSCHTRKTRIECGHSPALPVHPGRNDWLAALHNVPRN